MAYTYETKSVKRTALLNTQDVEVTLTAVQFTEAGKTLFSMNPEDLESNKEIIKNFFKECQEYPFDENGAALYGSSSERSFIDLGIAYFRKNDKPKYSLDIEEQTYYVTKKEIKQLFRM